MLNYYATSRRTWDTPETLEQRAHDQPSNDEPSVSNIVSFSCRMFYKGMYVIYTQHPHSINGVQISIREACTFMYGNGNGKKNCDILWISVNIEAEECL